MGSLSFYFFQALAAVKGRIVYFCHTIRNGNFIQTFTFIKGGFADGCHLTGNIDRGKISASVKGIGIDRCDRFGNGNLFEFFAIGKSVSADFVYGIGDIDFGQIGAFRESGGPDGFYGILHTDAGDADAAVESVDTDCFQIVRQSDGGNCGAFLKSFFRYFCYRDAVYIVRNSESFQTFVFKTVDRGVSDRKIVFVIVGGVRSCIKKKQYPDCCENDDNDNRCGDNALGRFGGFFAFSAVSCFLELSCDIVNASCEDYIVLKEIFFADILSRLFGITAFRKCQQVIRKNTQILLENSIKTLKDE